MKDQSNGRAPGLDTPKKIPQAGPCAARAMWDAAVHWHGDLAVCQLTLTRHCQELREPTPLARQTGGLHA